MEIITAILFRWFLARFLPKIQWRANFPVISAFQTNLSSSFECYERKLVSWNYFGTRFRWPCGGFEPEILEHSWLCKSTVISIRAHLSILYFFTHLKWICRFIVVCIIISSFNSVLNQDLQWLYRFFFSDLRKGWWYPRPKIIGQSSSEVIFRFF